MKSTIVRQQFADCLDEFLRVDCIKMTPIAKKELARAFCAECKAQLEQSLRVFLRRIEAGDYN